MKTILIILCAFLLKAEADAQTWQKISPESLTSLHRFKVVSDSLNRLHVFAVPTYERKLFHLFNSVWTTDLTFKRAAGKCTDTKFGPGEVFGFIVDQITELDKNQILIRYAPKPPTCQQEYYNNPSSFPAQLNSLKDGYLSIALDSINVTISRMRNFIYSPINKSLYSMQRIFDEQTGLFQEDRIIVFNLESSETDTSRLLGYPLSTNDEYLVDEYYSTFIVDRTAPATLFYTKLTTISYYEGEEFIVNSIYKSINNGKDWKLISELKNPSYQGTVYHVTDIPYTSNATELLLHTYDNLLYFNESTKQIDTVLRAIIKKIFVKENSAILIAFDDRDNPYHSKDGGKTWTRLNFPAKFQDILFKENSNLAYAGTATGEIYRSSDNGETWTLFASGFSTKPVIGIYASGNDSLIVGTEDGIWTNYQLPVSVAEENPFKKAELTITPNPANTSLKISFLKTELPQQLSVYNFLGELVFKTEFSGEFVWDFNNEIVDGVYTVAVQSGGKSVAKQVAILK